MGHFRHFKRLISEFHPPSYDVLASRDVENWLICLFVGDFGVKMAEYDHPDS